MRIQKKVFEKMFFFKNSATSWILSYLILFSMILAGCQKNTPDQVINSDELTDLSGGHHSDKKNTFYGPQVQMGNGKARSWITINHRNVPVEIGIEMTRSSLNGLPTDPENFPANTFILPLHHKAKQVTPFDHIVLNWEPNGHEPPGIYDVPHFDMHFYKISLQEQMAIGPVDPIDPLAGYLPASYVIRGASVPQMGTHWLDPSSPELPPVFAPFTHTFIYGSHEGKVTFYEPMITRSFLLGGTEVHKAFPEATKFSPSNTFYPSRYNIYRDEDNHKIQITLDHFHWK